MCGYFERPNISLQDASESPRMGRPDLTEKRTAEILDSFERCVGKFGLEGSSLEHIAEEAGMKRSILRHYVGNRDDLVVALTKRVVSKYRLGLDEFASSIRPAKRVDDLIQYLLPSSRQSSSESILVIESLIAGAEQYEEVRVQMLSYIDDVVDMITSQLRLEFPKRTKAECWTVAYGMVCIWFNQESLGPLGLPPKYLKSARSGMRSLIDTLGK
ncbi:MAG: TetR/AcrR family transcriptional regulator [Planctomycetota bacterium]